MSESLLEEYKAYYTVRSARFKNNPKYKYSYEAENRVAEAMLSCNELGEFKDKLGNKNELCTGALIKDEYLIRKQFYDKHQEVVRVKAAERILEKADNYTTALDIITLVQEEENKCSIEISMDEAIREFHSSWDQLDRIEIYENAEVPSKYKLELKEDIEEIKQSLKDSVTSLEENNDAWQPGWKLNLDDIMEHRHRRLLIYTDEQIKEKLAIYRAIVNR
jgi:hypothetical protein